jgi:hypothetical protein
MWIPEYSGEGIVSGLPGLARYEADLLGCPGAVLVVSSEVIRYMKGLYMEDWAWLVKEGKEPCRRGGL